MSAGSSANKTHHQCLGVKTDCSDGDGLQQVKGSDEHVSSPEL